MSDKDRKTVRWSKDREDALKRDQGGDLSELAATDYSTFSKGAPPADYRSYVLIWDSGKCSVYVGMGRYERGPRNRPLPDTGQTDISIRGQSVQG